MWCISRLIWILLNYFKYSRVFQTLIDWLFLIVSKEGWWCFENFSLWRPSYHSYNWNIHSLVKGKPVKKKKKPTLYFILQLQPECIFLIIGENCLVERTVNYLFPLENYTEREMLFPHPPFCIKIDCKLAYYYSVLWEFVRAFFLFLGFLFL